MGRQKAALAGLVGYFVNPVVLRANLSGNPLFTGFLDQVKQTVLAAFAHQDYPFPLLVEKLQPKRDPSRPPLFQTMFTLQQSPLSDNQELASLALGEAGFQIELGGMVLESVALEQQMVQFDLALVAAETVDGMGISLQYNCDLFEAATISRMLDHFQTLLEG
jgi:non-ribosomal peptide synthetase component F